jgi:DNA polymerase III subunit epsilon
VLCRPEAAGNEVVVLRHGRLAGATRLGPGASDGDIVAAAAGLDLEVHEGPPTRDDAEEVGLLLAWLDRPGGRVVAVRGRWAEPVAGGRALTDAVDEGRRVARAVRRDRQTLAGAKVTRRTVATPAPAAVR